MSEGKEEDVAGVYAYFGFGRGCLTVHMWHRLRLSEHDTRRVCIVLILRTTEKELSFSLTIKRF